MAKNRVVCAAVALTLAFSVGAYFVAPAAVFAEGGESEIQEDAVEVHDGTELYNAMLAGGSVRLADDIDAWYYVYVYNDTMLDLNGHSITFSDPNYYMLVYYGAILTIEGEGTIEQTVESNFAPVWAYWGGKVVMNSGTIRAVKLAVDLSYSGDDSDEVALAGGEFTMNGGNVVSSDWFGIRGLRNAMVTINDGAISSRYSCVTGNGNANDGGAEFYINGGTLTSEGWAIYAPQYDGVVEITGGEIIGATTGIEVRSGDLTITGGRIIAGEEVEYKVEPNGSGTTTYGAAVAIAQHTTRQPINVTISGGEFDAPVAFSEANPQDGENVGVMATISGGEFAGEVIAGDLSGFVAGGTYDGNLDAEYVAEGYVAVLNDDNLFEVLRPEDLDPADEIDSYIDEGTGEEIHYIAPRKIDYGDWFIVDGGTEEGHVPTTVDFGKELIADRKATLSSVEVDAADLSLDEAKGGELIGAVEINMLDRDGEIIEVKNNELTVRIDIDEEVYNWLAAYDKIEVVYFDEDGNEAERYSAELKTESYVYEDPETGETEERMWYWIEFAATHLSTYGVVGVSEVVPDDDKGAAADETVAPETGTVTAAGASANAASIATAVAVGVITMIVSFTYLTRKNK